ncbi:Zinc finger CCCH domain-containing protein 14 [Rhynchospora pubera]|uniref:Zinc finger CCCH domain-containing protein 14 n=1 Tax=Rhynchospora pubera TaxID=906938 RepID=A0AAV8CTD7_9POAL|nr:Zinc finger CCCH domain-containing protein 14 [Rhynchospora pubera]
MDSRKRTRPMATNGGAKRTKATDVGSKSKPCTKFFSMAGCPFGDGCHFLHHVPGGYNAVLQMTSHSTPAQHYVPQQAAPSGRFQAGPGVPNSPAVKSKLCSRYNTAEGCKFGDRCRFAHGERDLGRPIAPSHDYAAGPPMVPPMAPAPMPASGGAPAPGSFGMSAMAKISVEASLAGAIIGKGGTNTKQICRVTGAKLAIRDHESDPNLKNIELEGTFDQINHASVMVRELIFNVSGSMGGQKMKGTGGGHTAGGGSNYKTKLCDNFAKGVCTFGEKCNFAHGESELRQSGTGIV